MNILVLGCGAVGSHLVRLLDEAGHDISLVVAVPEALQALDAFEDYHFSGTALVGDPTDLDVLRQGGVESCDALAAVTDDDSDNLMLAQLAHTVFGVGRALCLVSDPALEKLYREQFGIETLCPAVLAARTAAGLLGAAQG